MNFWKQLEIAVIKRYGLPLTPKMEKALNLPTSNNTLSFGQTLANYGYSGTPVMPVPPTLPTNLSDADAQKQYNQAVEVYNRQVNAYKMQIMQQQMASRQQSIAEYQQKFQSHSSDFDSALSGASLGSDGSYLS